jgi:hypothetical protein
MSPVKNGRNPPQTPLANRRADTAYGFRAQRAAADLNREETSPRTSLAGGKAHSLRHKRTLTEVLARFREGIFVFPKILSRQQQRASAALRVAKKEGRAGGRLRFCLLSRNRAASP